MPTIDQLPIRLITEEDQIVRCELLPAACPDCGRVVENRTVTINYVKRPANYCRQKCNGCRKWRNNTTGTYDLDIYEYNKQMDLEIRQRDK